MYGHIDKWVLLLVISITTILLMRCLAGWVARRGNSTGANHILFGIVFTVIMGACVWWIANARSLAASDAASLHQMALSIIRDGDYSMIAPKGSYLSLWPFQTGLLLYYEGILRIVPDFNVVPMQILNWVYLGIGLLSGYFLVRKWFDDERVTACFWFAASQEFEHFCGGLRARTFGIHVAGLQETVFIRNYGNDCSGYYCEPVAHENIRTSGKQ